MNTIKKILASLVTRRESRITLISGNKKSLETTNTTVAYDKKNKKDKGAKFLISLMYSKENEVLFI